VTIKNQSELEKNIGRTKCQFSLQSDKVKAKCIAVTSTPHVPVEGLTGMFNLINNNNEIT
jgi:hypothetical protein